MRTSYYIQFQVKLRVKYAQFSLSANTSMMQVVNTRRVWSRWLLTIFPSTKAGAQQRKFIWARFKANRERWRLVNWEDAKLACTFKWELDKCLDERRHSVLKANPTSPGRCCQRQPTGAAAMTSALLQRWSQPGQPRSPSCAARLLREGTLHPGLDSTTHLRKSSSWPVDTLTPTQDKYLLKNKYLKPAL